MQSTSRACRVLLKGLTAAGSPGGMPARVASFSQTASVRRSGTDKTHYVKSSQFLVDHSAAAEQQREAGRSKTAMELVGPELHDMFIEIHSELDKEIHHKQDELAELAKYYFDGQGKAIRPVIAMTLAHAFNQDFQNRGAMEERKLEALLWKQRRA